MAAAILGYINCPSCGAVKGMRITHDKNGDPFGYCETDCSQQLRIGGNAKRVALFVANHPWAGHQEASPPVTVTEEKPESEPVTETVTKPTPHWTEHLGVNS